MGVIDVDPKILERAAAAALHASEQSDIHMQAEMAGKIPELMQTLTERGPYGYTIVPEVQPDGSVRLPVMTTFEGIQECYKLVRGTSDLLTNEPYVELRGTWYTFQETVNRGRLRATGAPGIGETAALFPSSTGKGITGELIWKRVPREILGVAPEPEGGWPDTRDFRLHLLALHDRYLAALRAQDIEGILDTYNDGVQGAVRDYVTDTGTLVSLDGKSEHRDYYKALFDLYSIEQVDMLDRVVQEWYAFAELRFVLRARRGDRTITFHTAEFFVPARDGRFIARIGHGTDPV
jgi:hypothetical protein